MYGLDNYAAVRRFVFVEGHSEREASRVLGLSRKTVAKMCRFSAPPGYMRTKPVERPTLGPFFGVIDAILESDRQAPAKQRHTAKRIFERLEAEQGYGARSRRRRAAKVESDMPTAEDTVDPDTGEVTSD